ncbi:MAG: MATE family efflux transporter [Woeseiaceae bacterium]|nr:MATE family efflux transporter [Woeseiaceae bacterium]NIP20522.1 MATE family efflux transporter [Woeseiaceae bacterium]NIS89116.1 MATE family efflux transporter [Woeseiaceae bacterium]
MTSFVRESVRDNEADYTRGPVGRALGLLAIPMMLEMSMESIFAVVDIAFVSRLGTDAIASIGITEALISVLYAIAVGLGMGVTAMVSRRIGANEREAAARVTGQAIWVGAALSLLIGIPGAFYAGDMLRLMGASDGVIETGTGFAAVLLGGSASIIYLFLLNAAFRGAGDASIALRSLVLANSLNIILDPCLIFGLGPFPELGVTGAAWATTIGRSIGVLYQLWYLFDARGRLRFRFRNLALHPKMLARMLVISAGGVGQFLIATSSWIIIMRIVALYGSTAVAAYTIGLRILEFVWLPSWGLGNAAATLVGQNLGAGRPDRAEASTWMAARYNTIFMTGVGITLLAFAPGIASLFTNDPEVQYYATTCLRILAVGAPAYAIGMIVVQAINGAGDTATPTVIDLFGFWVLQLPVAYWLATSVGMGPNGAFTAIVVAETFITVLGVIVFRRGRWKQVKA